MIKPEKSHFRPIWAPFAQKRQIKSFQKKLNCVNFTSLCCCNFQQFSMHWFLIILEKSHFWLTWPSFGLKTLKLSYSPKIVCNSFTPLCCCIFMQKIRKIRNVIFGILWAPKPIGLCQFLNLNFKFNLVRKSEN